MITALCGGVGGSKLVLGLYRGLPGDELSVIVNTADDLELFGLHVSPDLDTVTYTLSGLAQTEQGWGIEGDTFNTLDMLARYGEPDWFRVGDRDLATHIVRTRMLRDGFTLSEVTSRIAAYLGIRASLLPMTDGKVRTQLRCGGSWLEFQEFFVRRHYRDPVDEARYAGADEARPTRAVIHAIGNSEVVVIVNSNPVLSILPILSLGNLRECIASARCTTVAVSPIIGSEAVNGPAASLMPLLGLEPSPVGVARAYGELLDGIVIDHDDRDRVDEIQSLGVHVHLADTRMNDLAGKKRVARETVAFARSLA